MPLFGSPENHAVQYRLASKDDQTWAPLNSLELGWFDSRVARKRLPRELLDGSNSVVEDRLDQWHHNRLLRQRRAKIMAWRVREHLGNRPIRAWPGIFARVCSYQLVAAGEMLANTMWWLVKRVAVLIFAPLAALWLVNRYLTEKIPDKSQIGANAVNVRPRYHRSLDFFRRQHLFVQILLVLAGIVAAPVALALLLVACVAGPVALLAEFVSRLTSLDSVLELLKNLGEFLYALVIGPIVALLSLIPAIPALVSSLVKIAIKHPLKSLAVSAGLAVGGLAIALVATGGAFLPFLWTVSPLAQALILLAVSFALGSALNQIMTGLLSSDSVNAGDDAESVAIGSMPHQSQRPFMRVDDEKLEGDKVSSWKPYIARLGFEVLMPLAIMAILVPTVGVQIGFAGIGAGASALQIGLALGVMAGLVMLGRGLSAALNTCQAGPAFHMAKFEGAGGGSSSHVPPPPAMPPVSPNSLQSSDEVQSEAKRAGGSEDPVYPPPGMQFDAYGLPPENPNDRPIV